MLGKDWSMVEKQRGGEWIREQEVLKGESQEATGKQDALILQNVGVS